MIQFIKKYVHKLISLLIFTFIVEDFLQGPIGKMLIVYHVGI